MLTALTPSPRALPSLITEDGVPVRLYELSALAELGYGSKHTNLAKIRKGQIPAVKIAGAWKIRESDLGRLVEAVTTVV
ncbi:hypothetical protein [Brevibacterium sp. 'Marine']|uniref:hypothetical protein n=1 Tax=Brevibacterium sp. 'Marine' TaxID=2725563 RepID=UPI00145D4BEC|nr:hypothetical protein [Brevibacterium sp. 'Marine']